MQTLIEGACAAKDLDAQKIAAALRGSSVETILDGLRFEDDGDLADPQIWIYQVQDNEFRQVK